MATPVFSCPRKKPQKDSEPLRLLFYFVNDALLDNDVKHPVYILVR